MSYRYLEDSATADIAFEAKGKHLEELFRAAAEATLNVMIDNPEAIEDRIRRELEVEHEALDMLLFNFLQEIIFYKDAEQLLLRVETISIERTDGAYRLKARARGEKLDPQRHAQRVDVKAVTLHRFKVEEGPSGWEAFVILDI